MTTNARILSIGIRYARCSMQTTEIGEPGDFNAIDSCPEDESGHVPHGKSDLGWDM